MGLVTDAPASPPGAGSGVDRGRELCLLYGAQTPRGASCVQSGETTRAQRFSNRIGVRKRFCHHDPVRVGKSRGKTEKIVLFDVFKNL